MKHIHYTRLYFPIQSSRKGFEREKWSASSVNMHGFKSTYLVNNLSVSILLDADTGILQHALGPDSGHNNPISHSGVWLMSSVKDGGVIALHNLCIDVWPPTGRFWGNQCSAARLVNVNVEDVSDVSIRLTAFWAIDEI